MPGSLPPPAGPPDAGAVAGPEQNNARASLAVLAVFLVFYLATEIFSASRRNATYDEALHLTAGYVALTQGEFRFEPTHPPFLRMWAALPLLWQDVPPLDLAPLKDATPKEWEDQGYSTSYHFIHDGGQADLLLGWGRFMNMLWGAALGVMLFLWARAWLGFVPAVFVLAFYTMEPNEAAHFSLVTTDGGVTCFIFGSVYFLWRTQRSWTAGNVAGLAICVALAFVGKFSAVLLIPSLGILLGLAVARGTAISARRAGGIVLLLTATSWFAIWAAYGFRFGPDAAGVTRLQFETLDLVREELPRISAVAAWVDHWHLLPNAYTEGFIWGQSTAEGLMGYLFGHLSTDGWWYYFPAAFLLKTPAMLILLLLAGLVLALRPSRRGELSDFSFVALPVAVYLAFAMSTGINIGVRHILPIYPFVVLTAGLAFRAMDAMPARSGRAALAGMAVIAGLRFAYAYPNTLSFFNVFAGGSDQGIRYLADSNLDWGQHLKLLKRWMDREGVGRINLAYFGTVDPAYYGINYVNLPGSLSFIPITRPELPGYVAISATIQTGTAGLIYSAFRDLTPVAVIGHTIRVYRVERWPEGEPESIAADTDDLLDWQRRLADSMMGDVDWPEEAARQYRAYLTRRAGDSAVRAKLGLALLRTGRLQESMTEFIAAVTQDPDGAEMALSLAEILWRQGAGPQSLNLARRSLAMRPDNPRAQEIVAALSAAQAPPGGRP